MEAKEPILRIKELCKEQKIRQQDLAPELGISATSLSTAINEERLNIRDLKKIAQVLGVGISELFADSNAHAFRCPRCGTLLEVTIRPKQ